MLDRAPRVAARADDLHATSAGGNTSDGRVIFRRAAANVQCVAVDDARYAERDLHRLWRGGCARGALLRAGGERTATAAGLALGFASFSTRGGGVASAVGCSSTGGGCDFDRRRLTHAELRRRDGRRLRHRFGESRGGELQRRNRIECRRCLGCRRCFGCCRGLGWRRRFGWRRRCRSLGCRRRTRAFGRRNRLDERGRHDAFFLLRRTRRCGRDDGRGLGDGGSAALAAALGPLDLVAVAMQVMQRGLASNHLNHFMQSWSPSVHQRPRSLRAPRVNPRAPASAETIPPVRDRHRNRDMQRRIDGEHRPRLHHALDIVASHADRSGLRAARDTKRPITVTKRNIATPKRSVGSLDGMRKWQEAGWPPPESTGGKQILPLPPRCSDG